MTNAQGINSAIQIHTGGGRRPELQSLYEFTGILVLRGRNIRQRWCTGIKKKSQDKLGMFSWGIDVS